MILECRMFFSHRILYCLIHVYTLRYDGRSFVARFYQSFGRVDSMANHLLSHSRLALSQNTDMCEFFFCCMKMHQNDLQSPATSATLNIAVLSRFEHFRKFTGMPLNNESYLLTISFLPNTHKSHYMNFV